MLRSTVTNYRVARAFVRRVAGGVRPFTVWLALLLLVAAGCGASPAGFSERGGSTGDTQCMSEETTTAALDPDDPLLQDARSYAVDYGVSLEEAVRRLGQQEDPSLKSLEPELMVKERDTFAGLWIQHEPEYRYVVLFTGGGEGIMRPYLECNPEANLVEVRNGADATLAELMDAQEETGQITDSLDIPADSAIDVVGNRAELFVTDRTAFEAALQDAGERLPEHVVVIEVEGLAQPSVPIGDG